MCKATHWVILRCKAGEVVCSVSVSELILALLFGEPHSAGVIEWGQLES